MHHLTFFQTMVAIFPSDMFELPAAINRISYHTSRLEINGIIHAGNMSGVSAPAKIILHPPAYPCYLSSISPYTPLFRVQSRQIRAEGSSRHWADVVSSGGGSLSKTSLSEPAISEVIYVTYLFSVDFKFARTVRFNTISYHA